MSEENKSGSAAPQEPGKDSSESKEQFVSRKAYEEVTRDMHKNKQKAKELEAAFNELQAQLKAQEEAKMHEKEQWKELFEKREAELEQERQRARQIEQRHMKSVKVSALKSELGANIRDEYLQFAPLDSIVLGEDGSIDKDSLREVANSFRKEHGQLIPQSENVNITGQAANSNNVTAPVDLSKMSADQLVRHYAKLKQQS